MLRNRIALAAALGLLLALAWLGITGGSRQIALSVTFGQRVQTAAQFLYGLFSLLVAATAFGLRRWATAVSASWAIVLTVAGSLAPVVWGGSAVTTGILAGATALAIALAIIWLLRVGSPPRQHGDSM